MPNVLRAAESLHSLVEAALQTCNQINEYLTTYSAVSGQFPEQKLRILTKRFIEASTVAHAALSRKDSTSEDLFYSYDSLRQFHEDTIAICRELWTSFDTNYMAIGVILMIAATGGSGVWFWKSGGITDLQHLHSTIPLLVAGVLRCASLWSNSYIEAEQQVLNFMLVTVALMQAARRPALSTCFLLVLVRLLTAVTAGKHESFFSSAPPVIIGLGCFLPALFLPIGVGLLHRRRRAHQVPSEATPVKIFTGNTFGVCLYWASQIWTGGNQSWATRILLPRIIFTSCVVGALYVIHRSRSAPSRFFYLDVVVALTPSLMLILGPVSTWAIIILLLIVRR
jgi:hypothetical protein